MFYDKRGLSNLRTKSSMIRITLNLSTWRGKDVFYSLAYFVESDTDEMYY